MPKLFVVTSSESEFEYIREVCQVTDALLTDDDFEQYDSTDFTSALAYLKSNYSEGDYPFMIYPYALLTSVFKTAFDNYPGIPVFNPFFKNVSPPYPSMPATFNLSYITAPDRLSHMVLVGGGASGLADFWKGEALEFVEEAPIQYINAGTPVTALSITNITDEGGGIAKIYGADLSGFSFVNYNVHITGATGWANNPNGKFAVASVGSGFITIAHNLGAGAFGGTPTAKIHFSSGAVAVAAAKINKIMRERECDFWEARLAAQKTGSESYVHDVTTGYGSIDVSAAIAYVDEITIDPHDTIGAIGVLSIAITDGVAALTHPEIVNAKQYKVYDNGEEIFSDDAVYPGDTISYNRYPIKLGERSYKVKGFREKQETNFSNIVTSNITALEDYPPDLLYPKTIWEDLTVYYEHGAQVKSSNIVEAYREVTNPEEDNVGMVSYRYRLENGDLVDESKLFCSLNRLLYAKKGDYLNNLGYDLGEIFFEITPEDLCGLDLSNADLATAAEIDLTGTILAGMSFDGATLPAIYDGEVGRQLVLSSAKFVEQDSVIWTNGELISVEIV